MSKIVDVVAAAGLNKMVEDNVGDGDVGRVVSQDAGELEDDKSYRAKVEMIGVGSRAKVGGGNYGYAVVTVEPIEKQQLSAQKEISAKMSELIQVTAGRVNKAVFL